MGEDKKCKNNAIVEQANQAYCYEKGIGTEKDLERAFNVYTKLAEKGIPLFDVLLGRCYYEGIFVERDYSQALRWFRKAWKGDKEYGTNDGGVCLSGYYIGDCYYYGHGVKKNYKKAVDWYKKVAVYPTDIEKIDLKMAECKM